ncbi:hypothetical protein HQ325_00525 [Rhodococcus sp. BP-349]|nr:MULTISPECIES: hypothetical protein [unclassified Rhodococcus (in: high G+C Gram-positive bacteria)]MBY6537149.1 hypothetical protein [Rhodococcus sp. BP-363]MBY6541486.1 hypothetical protein [Rhodococcus sp. BP-369]MBY6560716.1 hypothetical protein [Rhodococcus sp. BP-370]MBY6575008.1 hypothetical protein [Rhodococcus sp. BP-364]MBY6584309.1 hypothetical protein [Rhodococcus sp. BP-358]
MEPEQLFLAPVTADAEPVEAPATSAARDVVNAAPPVYTQLFSEKN